MDLLKLNNSGFSLIETLVTIVIVGLLMILVASFFESTFHRVQSYTKLEALRIASNEISQTIYFRTYNDTSYLVSYNNLIIRRNVTQLNEIYRINIDVKDKAGYTILTLSEMVRK